MVSLLWNLFLAYCAAVVDILIKYVVPEALLEWDPLFGNWSLFWRVCFAGTTGSLILSICITLLLMRITRGPLRYRLTSVAAYRLVYLLFFPGLALLVKFPVPFVIGMVFFLCLGWTYLLAFGKKRLQATVHQG